jgi:hypothetical protein
MPRTRKISFAGFKDPARRNRYILWTIAGVLVVAAALVVSVGVISTTWFCSNNCHAVLGDTIAAHDDFSHSEVSCSACHMPRDANPVGFLLDRSLGELYRTATNDYRLPLNLDSDVALTMASDQCTQCHNLKRRKITPTSGVLIDHEVHAKEQISCTICHNRAAHHDPVEGSQGATLSAAPSKAGHPQFLSMTACFRCHTQGTTRPGGIKAPGSCETCHPADFELKPASHRKKGFFPGGHGKLGLTEANRVAELDSTAASQTAEVDNTTEGVFGTKKAAHIGPGLPKVDSINECSTCHSERFCSDCHGIAMPHPADFKDGHAKLGKNKPETCSYCHGDEQEFCDACHHGRALNRKYTKNVPWVEQHPKVVPEIGAAACFKCHRPTYCAECHVQQSR